MEIQKPRQTEKFKNETKKTLEPNSCRLSLLLPDPTRGTDFLGILILKNEFTTFSHVSLFNSFVVVFCIDPAIKSLRNLRRERDPRPLMDFENFQNISTHHLSGTSHPRLPPLSGPLSGSLTTAVETRPRTFYDFREVSLKNAILGFIIRTFWERYASSTRNSAALLLSADPDQVGPKRDERIVSATAPTRRIIINQSRRR